MSGHGASEIDWWDKRYDSGAWLRCVIDVKCLGSKNSEQDNIYYLAHPFDSSKVL